MTDRSDKPVKFQGMAADETGILPSLSLIGVFEGPVALWVTDRSGDPAGSPRLMRFGDLKETMINRWNVLDR